MPASLLFIVAIELKKKTISSHNFCYFLWIIVNSDCPMMHNSKYIKQCCCSIKFITYLPTSLSLSSSHSLTQSLTLPCMHIYIHIHIFVKKDNKKNHHPKLARIFEFKITTL
ncbi:hypothetical protein S245_001104 [Arachis hypogaea]